ncbi:hypothetical protein [Nakamurella sp.]|uniref:hypothetical protein n=1 Tax=Nakamurella sp. TaxID=1869182 RepID=UPI0037847AAC
MAEHTGRTGAAPPRIIEATLPRDTELVERGLCGIRQEGALDHHTVQVTDDIRTELIANLDYISTSIDRAGDPDLTAPDRIGRGCTARGVPLADLLAAHRLELTGRAAVTTARPERYRPLASSFRPEGHPR